MKKRTLQKLLSCVLAGAMAASMLVGCGSDDADTAEVAEAAEDTEDAEDAEDEVELDENVVAGMDGWVAFENAVELQIPVYDRGEGSTGCSDVVTNYWTNWVQENFGDKWNINVTYVPIGRSTVIADYNQLASTDSLPTICAEYDYDKLAGWAADGIIVPYDQAEFKTIAPTYWQNMVDNGIDGYTKLIVDGEEDDYLVLGRRPYGNTNYRWTTWYRQDWLEEAGFSEYPETTTELIKLYEKIQENHPGVYPAQLAKASGAGLDQNYGYRDYPQDETVWATTGTYEIPALSTEAQKRFLKLNNYFYQNGMLDPEYYLTETTDYESKFINGQAFTYTAYIGSNLPVLDSFYETNPDAKLGVVVNSGKFTEDKTWGTNNSYRPNNIFGAMVGFSSDAGEDEIKAAMMYLEWMSQDDVLFTLTWGEKGINYTIGEDGNPVAKSNEELEADGNMDYQQGHNNNVDYWMLVTASKSFGDIEADVKAETPVGTPQDFYEDILANYYGQLALYEAGYANSDCAFGAQVESATEYKETLYSEKYPEYRDELIQFTGSDEDWDALYDELSQKYLDDGYQEIIDEKLDLYENDLSTKLK